MDAATLITIILLGIVEGVTEFIPVSSTGHLILASELLGYDAAQWAVFNVVIQLGAILAVIVLYWRTFWAVLTGLLKNQPESWRFVRNIAIGFLPSAVLGLLLHRQIEAMLGSAAIVAWALIAGGIAILIVERSAPQGSEKGVADISFGKAAGVGLIQCLSMIPGVSRSGATILGGIAIGFIVSFLVALVVIRWFIGIVSRRGFAPFAWYRIVAGAAALLWLTMR
jgi:undecaprenyl-diphosphatase